MQIVKESARIADIILSIFTTLLALALLFTSGYILYDNFYKGQNAFVSNDLLQYKPGQGNTPALSFRMIREINPDTVAWLTVYDTHIDYPVVQGKDDLEYASKDIYGAQSLTGSIYLSAANSSDMGDWYNIIYGHHMDNGAMFGDIEKYSDMEYFLTHRSGLLTTPDGNYDLTVFACMRTDAYDNFVYYTGNHEQGSLTPLINYIIENSENHVDIDPNSITKLVALSTCYDAVTNGRMVLFAGATPRMIPVTGSDGNETPAVSERIAEGHGASGKSWALLNLICVFATFLTLMPLTFLRKKYGQFFYAREQLKEISDTLKGLSEIKEAIGEKCTAGGFDLVELTDGCTALYSDVYDQLKAFCRKAMIGIILEIAAVIAAVIAFILTENIKNPMTIRDEYTGLMVVIFALSLLIDYIFLRYRGTKPDQIPYYVPKDKEYQPMPT